MKLIRPWEPGASHLGTIEAKRRTVVQVATDRNARLGAALCAAAAATATAAAEEPVMAFSRSYSPLPPLIPPFRHCLVEDGLYRGAHPSLKNLRFMRRLKLRTILSLVPEASGPSRDLREYCQAERIRLIWHQVDKYDDGFSHTPQLVASVLSHMVDPRNHPLFLHCRDGSHNTGLVVMCLRRLQNWSLPTIYEEFVRYTKSNDISFSEKQFVESFHAKVTIPITIPHWLWEGVRHRRHPSIQLELEKDPDTPNTSLRSLNTPDSGEAEHFVPLTSPHPKRQDDSLRRWYGPSHKQIRMHYTAVLGGLDLCGVHFAACCRPDIDGVVVKGSNHTATYEQKYAHANHHTAGEQDPNGVLHDHTDGEGQ